MKKKKSFTEKLLISKLGQEMAQGMTKKNLEYILVQKIMKDSKQNVVYQKSIEVSLKEFLPCKAGVTSIPKEIIMILQIIAH